jgi:hypothetical protein
MKETVKYCKILSSNGFKWPKLEELYQKLFNEKYDNTHNAFSDIKATARCFWELKQNGMFSFAEKSASQELIEWWEVVKERPNKYTFHESIDKKYLPINNYTVENILLSNNMLPLNYSNNIELIKKIQSIYITNCDIEASLNYGIDNPVFEDEDYEVASDFIHLNELDCLNEIRYERLNINNFNSILSIKNLNKIYFDSCGNIDLDTISKLENIVSITLIYNKYEISDLENIAYCFSKLKKLEYLKIKGLKDLVNFSPLYQCNNIKYLIIE